jgi:WD repeat-containing protein 48
MFTSGSKSERRSLSRVFTKPSATPPPPQQQENPLLSKYAPTGKHLGDSAVSNVFVMRRRADGNYVAVKRFRKARPSEDRIQYARQVVAEYYIGAKLNHTNIIRNFELIDTSEQFHQIMEYAPYELFDRVASRQMSPEEIRCTFGQICSGLAYLHKSGFAHRDMKLENVVYTGQGIMKLIDFGVAADCQSKEEFTTSQNGKSQLCPRCERLAASNNPLAGIGTRPYMAPELFTQKVYRPKMADVWALGIVFCSIVLGRFPWKEATQADPRYVQFSASRRNSTLPPSKLENTRHAEVQVVEIHLSDSETSSIEEPTIVSTPPRKPFNLFDVLPESSKELIQSLLQTNPRQRWTMDQVIRSNYVQQAPLCSRRRDGQHDPSIQHRHTQS